MCMPHIGKTTFVSVTARHEVDFTLAVNQQGSAASQGGHHCHGWKIPALNMENGSFNGIFHRKMVVS